MGAFLDEVTPALLLAPIFALLATAGWITYLLVVLAFGGPAKGGVARLVDRAVGGITGAALWLTVCAWTVGGAALTALSLVAFAHPFTRTHAWLGVASLLAAAAGVTVATFGVLCLGSIVRQRTAAVRERAPRRWREGA
jgi:hypothetical protein